MTGKCRIQISDCARTSPFSLPNGSGSSGRCPRRLVELVVDALFPGSGRRPAVPMRPGMSSKTISPNATDAMNAAPLHSTAGSCLPDLPAHHIGEDPAPQRRLGARR